MRKVSLLLILAIAVNRLAMAGGPAYVAGVGYFDPNVKGTPVTWPNGAISYYADQGNFSTLLSGPNADTFAAGAFAAWTSIPTAAVSAARAGQLAEDVNGTNALMIGGTLNMPADVLPSASTTPVGIVYDSDGSVTDALLGAGASGSAFCSSNGVFGGIDNFSTGGQFVHALIILNGNCAASSAQLPDLKYHLIRIIGRVFGLDWSQANLNVITRTPPPVTADYSGFPVMHESDPTGCVPVANCYSGGGAVDPSQPKMDDQASLSRLYPVTTQNVGSFPGKQIFAQQTARIHGSVYFGDAAGVAAQSMQGVNVVARWIDPATHLPTGTCVATSVSVFHFSGTARNLVSGFTDNTGQSVNRFGSDDPTLEGFFDLAGLQIPAPQRSISFRSNRSMRCGRKM